MSVAQTRGGIPHVFRGTIQLAGRKHQLPFYTNYCVFRVASGSANGCRLFFTEDDYTNNENYVVVLPPGANQTTGEWCGPAELEDVWFRGDGGPSDIEFVAFQRRG